MVHQRSHNQHGAVLKRPPQRTEAWLARLHERVTINGGCWIYGDDPSAYGSVTASGRRGSLHRAVYQFVHPDDDIDGMDVHHTCLTPACINPAHLVALSAEEHRAEHGWYMSPYRHAPNPDRLFGFR